METTLTFLSLGNYTEGTSAKGAWKKQEAVFETRGDYPHKVCVIGFNAMADTLQKCTQLQPYDVKIDVESREFNGKWYTDCKCYGIAAHATGTPAPAPAKETQTRIDIVPPAVDPNGDLPF